MVDCVFCMFIKDYSSSTFQVKYSLHYYLSDSGNSYNSLFTLEINHTRAALSEKEGGEPFLGSRQKSSSSAQESRTLLIETNGIKSYLAFLSV